MKKVSAVTPEKAIRPVESKKDMKEYLSKKLNALKSRQKDEDYKKEQLSRLESKKRLSAIRQTALLKSSQSDAAENMAEAEAERSRILDEYLGKIHDSIYDVWVYPEMDVKGLEASIVITVMRDGRILIKRFATASGNKIFDGSAVKALQKASPVELPPFGKNTEEIVINFIPYEK
jgi:colicin import membrane protein